MPRVRPSMPLACLVCTLWWLSWGCPSRALLAGSDKVLGPLALTLETNGPHRGVLALPPLVLESLQDGHRISEAGED